jgi:AcrR family transcriptional regulator
VSTASDDFRHGPRRRGHALESAIYAATLHELAERSFAGLSIKQVAERAGTGRSAIYRRWPGKLDLVVDALADAFPAPPPAASTGDLRTDLLRFHRRFALALAGPVGAALRANIGQEHQHPELGAALHERIIGPRQAILRGLLLAGVERGDVRPDALAPECVGAGLMLLRQHFLETAAPIPERTVRRLVDNVLIPMVSPNARASS